MTTATATRPTLDREPSATLLVIGLGGWTAHVPSYRTPSGLNYGSGTIRHYATDPDRAAVDADTKKHRDRENERGRLAVGAPVVDLRAVAETDPRRVIRAPMATGDPSADPFTLGESSRWLAEALAGEIPALGCFLALHEIRTEGEPGALDRLPPAEFAAWWAANGARVGIWDGSRIVWAA